ncbi:hypothetical protein ZIOFF_060178 [Zingiber officinale]|uniref:Uncharacterized protein n=1 Tax=Zingiber officinale TaxID=94328 RepID=A0A8J5FGB5_ZINOF|nr:hypothetical protein ZIOFF_060178 [Zingiber officinale]
MVEKGRWFSVIKRAFTASSKEEAPHLPRGRRVMKKRWGFGMSKHDQISTFIHGESSSIEKILEDAESEWRRQRVQTTIELDHALISAIKIQAAYRVRRRYKALRGMMRLQRAVRGQEVKRQMANTMRHMQRLVRAQSQVKAWRSRMAESKRLQLLHHAERNLPRQEEAVGGHGEWDDNLLAKEQLEVRMHRRVEAVEKRERAPTYAYSHHIKSLITRSSLAAPSSPIILSKVSSPVSSSLNEPIAVDVPNAYSEVPKEDGTMGSALAACNPHGPAISAPFQEMHNHLGGGPDPIAVVNDPIPLVGQHSLSVHLDLASAKAQAEDLDKMRTHLWRNYLPLKSENKPLLGR